MSQPLPTILITRPMGQQQAFAESCARLGLRVSHLASLIIEPLFHDELSADFIEQFDSVLFTSKNAVSNAHRLFPMPWSGIEANAIGPATSAALAELDQTTNLTPKPPFTSESHLRQLVDLPAQKLLIVKGAGGRTLISDILSELGWTVTGVDVYKRSLPIMTEESINELIQDPAPDLISITSNEALQNLEILAKEHWDTLRKLPLVVNSKRSATLAQSMGFELPALVAGSAGDEGQLEQIKLWMSKR